MIEIFRLAKELQDFCEARDWRFCFIGGVAVQFWAELRATRDVDMTLLTGFGNERPFIEALLDRFESRVANPMEHAERTRVVLLKGPEGIGIDIAMGAFPFEESAILRSKKIEAIDGIQLRVCSAEDLIVFKVFATRAKDWGDVEATIIRQGDAKLDWVYVREQLVPLLELKEAPELLDQLEALRVRVRRRQAACP